MSAGPRIDMATARKVVDLLFAAWHLRTCGAMVVGSVRREKPDVGDIEIAAALPGEGVPDHLHRAIQATEVMQEGLFGGGPVGVCGGDPPAQVTCTVVQGLKPGFKSCRLRVTTVHGVVPVEIYRFTPANRGWTIVRTTGPGAFGKHFLAEWKKAHGIDHEKPASVDGNLVDAFGRVVELKTEDEAFAACRMPYIQPRDRERWSEGGAA